MPSFSAQSKHKLSTCHAKLQELMNDVIMHYDCTIITGYRTEEEQERMVEAGRSKVHFPHSKHNKSPALAVDVGPYLSGRGIPWPQAPTDWNDRRQVNQYLKDTAQFYHFAGFIMAKARAHGLSLRWGGDWDRDHVLSDQSFDDLVHFELV